jgi:N-acetyl-beta-hexosaminidase
MPGHAYSWGKYYPKITAECQKFGANVNNIPLNPINQEAYDMIIDILTFISTVFKNSNYIHIGGDELLKACWNIDPSIIEYMKTQPKTEFGEITTMDDLSI